jgi:hypothetical protein
MEIDRRELLTGLTAATVAPILPALPALGASFRGRRFYFPEGLLFSLAIPWSLASNRAHYESRWHFDPNPKGHALIQHEGSGLTFRRKPQPDNPFVMEAFFIDDTLEGWPDAERMAAVGRAAVWAFVDGNNLRYWERRTGAFYFRDRHRMSEGDYKSPYVVEDAPALF